MFSQLAKQYKKTGALHHAFLLEEHEQILEELFAFLEEIGVATRGNPDFWHRDFEIFGIDEGRELRALQTQSAFKGDKRLFIIRTKTITPEAQNALLKTLEEPTAGTHFFLIVPNRDLLLPTLLSRVTVVGQKGALNKDTDKHTLVHDFLNATPTARLKLLEEIIEEKDRPGATVFLDGLETAYADKTKKDTAEFLETLLEFKKYLSLRGSSVKMILEHISLTAPKK